MHTYASLLLVDFDVIHHSSCMCIQSSPMSEPKCMACLSPIQRKATKICCRGQLPGALREVGRGLPVGLSAMLSLLLWRGLHRLSHPFASVRHYVLCPPVPSTLTYNWYRRYFPCPDNEVRLCSSPRTCAKMWTCANARFAPNLVFLGCYFKDLLPL